MSNNLPFVSGLDWETVAHYYLNCPKPEKTGGNSSQVILILKLDKDRKRRKVLCIPDSLISGLHRQNFDNW